jgi:hypothetical protein
MADGEVLVQVVPVARDKARIRFGEPNVADALDDRIDDIRRAVSTGTAAIGDSLAKLASPDGWSIGEVSAAFGIALTAEAGVLITKASVGATFDVTVKFSRDETDAGHGPDPR